jgi:hsp70-interacting protein
MSAEDRAFLENVMRDGIIDENELMKTILKKLAGILDGWKERRTATPSEEVLVGSLPSQRDEEEEEEAAALLDELRDIVEQIDYARAFCALKGLPFLLGCAQEREFAVPRSTRTRCLAVLATLAQHNPPVQKELLNLGALKTLSDLFFYENDHSADDGGDADGELRSRIVQAISATVRGYDVAEQVFGELEQATSLVDAGLGLTESSSSSSTPIIVRKRTLFFLRALVTSDFSNRRLVERFAVPISAVANDIVVRNNAGDSSSVVELLEMGLSLLVQILEQKRSVDAVLRLKGPLVGAGVAQISALRQLQGEEREEASHRLELWEQLLRLLASAAPNASAVPQ